MATLTWKSLGCRKINLGVLWLFLFLWEVKYATHNDKGGLEVAVNVTAGSSFVIWTSNISSATSISLLLPTARALSSVSLLVVISLPMLLFTVVGVYTSPSDQTISSYGLDIAKVSIRSLHSSAGPCDACWGDSRERWDIIIDAHRSPNVSKALWIHSNWPGSNNWCSMILLMELGLRSSV